MSIQKPNCFNTNCPLWNDMQDVIKELERRMINLDNNGCWNSLEGYKEALALIRDGME
jgi:hypothetical protein